MPPHGTLPVDVLHAGCDDSMPPLGALPVDVLHASPRHASALTPALTRQAELRNAILFGYFMKRGRADMGVPDWYSAASLQAPSSTQVQQP